MELNINILIADFTKNLDKLIQDSQLPIGVLHYIIDNYNNNITNQYIGYINAYMLEHPIEFTETIAPKEDSSLDESDS